VSPHVYHHHPWTHGRKASGPVRVADQLPESSAVQRLNTAVALKITSAVGTMWCAYIFGAFDLLALPTAIRGGLYGIVQWVASFFLQLVLLSIIMVGQNVQAKAADRQSLATFNDGESSLHEILQAQDHLIAQDELIRDTQKAILAAIATGQAGLGPALKAHIDGVLAAHQETLVTSLVNAMPPAEPPQKGKR
jgi:hypothetical protein